MISLLIRFGVILAMSVVSLHINAQVILSITEDPAAVTIENGNNSLRKNELSIDTVKYQITYRSSLIPDTANHETKEEGFTVTLVGGNYAKFMDKADLDSWLLRRQMRAAGKSRSEIMMASVNSRRQPVYVEEFIMNYPQKDVNTVLSYLAGTMRQYNDDGAIQNWSIGDETKEILGYKCRKATCRFRGRDYEAWYAEELPIPYGPYNFRGLPGLIVELYDTGREYEFLMVGIERPSEDMPMILNISKTIEKISRNDFRKLKEYYNDNAAGSLLDGQMRIVVSSDEERTELEKRLNGRRPYNPIEKE
ncbi:MAG: GLPGLI family protein [Muribaculaceae bacterium]|nr:GLPGLI family protein [Muribaculaceae bacterium]